MAYGDTILFDALKNILQLKSEEMFKKHTEMDNFEKAFPRFMVLRYLSMCSDPAVQKLICENQVTLERFPCNLCVYRFLMDAVPRQRSGFIRYIK